MNGPSPAPPKVFVSYSHDSEEHKNRVLALSDRLREGGIDTEVDQYNSNPPEGWPRWMDRQIQSADFVLLVCTETYCRRFEGKEVPGRGLGSGWEGAVVTLKIYEAAGANSRFVPITFSEGDEAHIPGSLRGVSRYRVDTRTGYEELYRRLTGQPAVLRPALGPIQPLPPRPRAPFFTPAHDPSASIPRTSQGENTTDNATPRLQKGVVVLSVILGTAILAILGVFLNFKKAFAPEPIHRKEVYFAPQLAAVTSASWSPDNSELLLVGARTQDDDNSLFRYSLEGKLVTEVVAPIDGGVRVERPASAQTVDREFVVKDEDVFVWLTESYHSTRVRDLLAQSANGDSLESAFEWAFAEGRLFVIGDVKKGEREPVSVDNPSGEKWERGIVAVPLDSPGDFDMVRVIASDNRLSGLYLMGYPHLAKAGAAVYFLEMNDTPEVVRLRPNEWSMRGIPVRLSGFEKMPDFSGKRKQEAYNLFESSAMIVGLYGLENSLFVLSKCPATTEMPTRWFITRFDAETRRQLNTISLPVASPNLTIAPGLERWAVLERGPAFPCQKRRMCSKTSSLILVPTSEILGLDSPLQVDTSLPPCSLPASWSDDPPGWKFGVEGSWR